MNTRAVQEAGCYKAPEIELEKVVARTGFEHGGAGEGMQCTDPGQAASDTGGWAGGELVAHPVPSWNQLQAWLSELNKLQLHLTSPQAIG